LALVVEDTKKTSAMDKKSAEKNKKEEGYSFSWPWGKGGGHGGNGWQLQLLA